MKTLSIFLILSLISIFSYAQWQINGGNIYYDQGNVGIGLSDPNNKLEIAGLEDFANDNRTFIKLINNSVSQNSLVSIRLFAGENNSFTSLTHLSETYLATSSQIDFGQIRSTGAGFILSAPYGVLRFETGLEGVSEERMKIDSLGNIGIGTSLPQAKLEIADGDIFISDIERGIIMKSPDGQCWRGTLNNDGSLNFVQVECPGLITKTNFPKDSNSNEVLVFPNPTDNSISIKFKENEFKKINYTLSDPYGSTIMKGTLKSSNDKINISFLSAGIYFINISNRSGHLLTSQKIIKK